LSWPLPEPLLLGQVPLLPPSEAIQLPLLLYLAALVLKLFTQILPPESKAI